MSSQLPTFLILGAAKSGTTSLYSALGKHPDVFVSYTKEIHYFDDDQNWARGEDWYRTFFETSGGERAVGEATPSYLANPVVPARIAKTVPGVRLIAILRDPVQRARSWYFHMRYFGWEHRSFEEAVAEELQVPGWDLPPHYLAGGRYRDQLERLTEYFDREQILVALLDDLQADPGATFETVMDHVGVDPTPGVAPRVAENTYKEVRLEPLARRIQSSRLAARVSPRSRERLVRAFTRTGVTPPPIDPATSATLYAAFEEENEKLGAWLGRDLSMWSGSRTE